MIIIVYQITHLIKDKERLLEQEKQYCENKNKKRLK